MVTRREKVLLELEDQFSRQMVKPIAATKALDAALDSLSGSSVQTSRDQEKVTKSTKALGDEVDKTSKKVGDGSKQIDKYSGRLRLLTEAAVVLGPALVPIGAVGVPATIALAGAMGAAVGSVGIAVLAFKGLGDGLKALDEYQLNPTKKNLQAMQEEMAALGPAGAEFVRFLDDLEPEFRRLQNTARAGLFPGVEAGLSSLLDMLPQVRLIIFKLATEMGHLSAEAGAALSGPGFAAFFEYLETDAAPTLEAFAHSIGNVAMGLGSLLVAFAPLSRDFTSGMEAMTQSFAGWAAGLSQTQGFRDFVAYIHETGPQVLALLGSLASAFVDIAVAAAPVGGAVLTSLTALAKILSVIAGSPIGPPLFTAAAAMLALSRATTIANGALLRFNGSTAAGAANLLKLKGALNFAAILAGIHLVDKAFGDRRIDGDNLIKNLTNLGTSDAAAQLDKIGASIVSINSSIGQANDKVFGFLPGDTTWGEARDNIEDVDKALAQLVDSGSADQAAAAMAEIVKQANAQGISTEEATKWFKLYNAAVADSKSIDVAAGAQRRYTRAVEASGRVNKITRAQVEALNESMEKQTEDALSAFDAVTQYARALDDAHKQAAKSNDGIKLSAKLTDKQRLAVLKNRDALSGLAQAWNDQGDKIRNNMGKWQQARAQFIRVAEQMGATRQEARKLADDILDIPTRRQIDIKLYGSEQAASQIENVRREMATLKDKTVRLTYYVNQVNTINRGQSLPGNPDGAGADGGTVHGPRNPYGDKMLYMLAPGEEIISNRYGQADRFRADRAAGLIPGYADGGTTGNKNGLNLPAANVKNIREVAQALKEMTHAAKMTANALDRQTNKLDRLTSRRDEIRSSIESGLRSDIFATPAAVNPWTSAKPATADPLAALRGDNAEIHDFLKDIRTLRRHKVTGAALAEALTNPAYADLLANMPASELTSYQALYGKRERLLNQAGVAGSSAVGIDRAVAAQSRLVDALTKREREQAKETKALTRELQGIKGELAKLRNAATSGQRSHR